MFNNDFDLKWLQVTKVFLIPKEFNPKAMAFKFWNKTENLVFSRLLWLVGSLPQRDNRVREQLCQFIQLLGEGGSGRWRDKKHEI